jgi:hypothetical protein
MCVHSFAGLEVKARASWRASVLSCKTNPTLELCLAGLHTSATRCSPLIQHAALPHKAHELGPVWAKVAHLMTEATEEAIGRLHHLLQLLVACGCGSPCTGRCLCSNLLPGAELCFLPVVDALQHQLHVCLQLATTAEWQYECGSSEQCAVRVDLPCPRYARMSCWTCLPP